MRKKIMAFVFTAGLALALAVPLFGGATVSEAGPDRVCVDHEEAQQPGHPLNQHLWIPESAVAGHLSHGDHIDPDDQCSRS